MRGERQYHTGDIALSIPSEERYIYLVDTVTSHIVSEMEFGEEIRGQVSLAVIEAGTNAIKHGNECDPRKTVEFCFHMEQDKLTVFVRDYGSGFDLECIENPLVPENLMKPYGRGIFLMRSLMDQVIYSIDRDCGTEVQLVKHRNSSGSRDNEGSSGYVLGSSPLLDTLTILACA
jgi:serine/threonine-protein kinase RsbW